MMRKKTQPTPFSPIFSFFFNTPKFFESNGLECVFCCCFFSVKILRGQNSVRLIAVFKNASHFLQPLALIDLLWGQACAGGSLNRGVFGRVCRPASSLLMWVQGRLVGMSVRQVPAFAVPPVIHTMFPLCARCMVSPSWRVGGNQYLKDIYEYLRALV